MKMILATNNAHKVGEFSRCFADAGLDIELIPIRATGFTGDIIENADDFNGNALIKAKTLCEFSGMTAIADDSGLCVDALGGRPGVHSARFAGGNASDAENNALLLESMKDVPEGERTARFVCVICVCRPDGKTLFVRGEAEGKIGFSPKGEGRFGYDPLFFYPPLGMTFAEMDGALKNSVSHRGNAVRALLEHRDFLVGK